MRSKPKVNVTRRLSNNSIENSTENLTLALVYNHLKEVAPGLAKQFGSEHKCQGTELNLGEVVNVFILSKSQSSTTSKDSHENLTKSLVFNHLMDVAPQLAKQFKTEHKFERIRLQLREVVNVFNTLKQATKIVEKSCVNINEGHVRSSWKARGEGVNVRRRFTPDEDDFVKAAIAQAGDEEVDFKALAELLNRKEISVKSRVKLVKRTGGVKSILKQRFTLVEDQTLIEMLIIPRLSGEKCEKLSQVILLRHQVADVAKELNKDDTSVMNRWHRILQPWLLQH